MLGTFDTRSQAYNHKNSARRKKDIASKPIINVYGPEGLYNYVVATLGISQAKLFQDVVRPSIDRSALRPTAPHCTLPHRTAPHRTAPHPTPHYPTAR